MLINRANFYPNLDKIFKIIKQSQFISLDLEMSGLIKGDYFRNSSIDSLQHKYWKIKENVRDFLPIQLGLCGFSFEGNSANIEKITAFPMSFYLYPYSLHDSLDKVFKFEKDTLEFLLTHQFDFNKLFYEGVYFISREAEKKLRESKSHNEVKKRLERNSRIITPDMIAFRAIHEEKIKDFAINESSIGKTLEITIKYMKVRVYKYFEEILIENFKSSLEITYDNESIRDRTKMIIKRIDPNQPKTNENEEKKEIIDNNLKTNLILEEGNISGLRAVFELIIAEKKPLILHNGIYDILQIYDKMLQTPPELYVSFFEELYKNFEAIYDTKFILTSSSLLFGQLINQKSDLFSAYTSLQTRYFKVSPIIEIDKSELNEEFELKNHDAMSDAYMTGFVFLKCLSLLDILKEYHNKSIFDQRVGFFKNKLFNYGSKVPFIIEKIPNNKNIKRVFQVQDHKLDKLDKNKLEKHLQSKFGPISLFENTLGFYFFLSNDDDEKKLIQLIVQENGLLIDKFENINLLINETSLSESLDICLKDDEEVLMQKTTTIPLTEEKSLV